MDIRQVVVTRAGAPEQLKTLRAHVGRGRQVPRLDGAGARRRRVRVGGPHVDSPYPLPDAGRAHQHIEARRSTGKVVLEP